MLKHFLLFVIYKILFPLPLRIFGIKIYGRQHLKLQKQWIIVANHNSHADTMALMSSIPFRMLRKTHPVATAQYFGKNKGLVWLSNLLVNTVLIKRREDQLQAADQTPEPGQTNALELLEEKLAQGHSLIFFPEGTRGEPEKLQAFRKGIGVLLHKFPNVHFVPVYIHGTGKILPKGALLPVPHRANIRIGKPQLAAATTVEELVKDVEEKVLALSSLT